MHQCTFDFTFMWFDFFVLFIHILVNVMYTKCSDREREEAALREELKQVKITLSIPLC